MIEEDACDVVFAAIEKAANCKIGFMSVKSRISDFDRILERTESGILTESIAEDVAADIGIPVGDEDFIPDVVKRLMKVRE